MKLKPARFASVAALTAASALCLMLLTGCETSSSMGKAIDSMSGNKTLAQKRLSTAASEAIAAGRADEAVAYYEKLYLKDSHNPDVALNYAQALRKTKNSQRATVVLAPFVEGKGKKFDPLLATEYASASVEIGNYDQAFAIAEKIIDDSKLADLHPAMHNVQGIVFDSREQHKEAEAAYRLALDGWQGDATPVMNNLALCLVSQGLFDDALTTLRQALVIAPDRAEISRNIEIVSDLRKSVLPTPVSLQGKKK